MLNHGNLLIVGAKVSNFDPEISTHPRVILWESQDERWVGKDLPINTQAVFLTKFVGHAQTDKIIQEARKKRIPITHAEGTGIIAKQVRQMLNLEPVVTKEKVPVKEHGKLHALIPSIDFTKSNIENAKFLLEKAKELGITTTEASLAHLVSSQRRKQSATAVPRSIRAKVDVSVEILDSMIQQLNDMRDFLIATVEENRTLRARVDKLKRALDE